MRSKHGIIAKFLSLPLLLLCFTLLLSACSSSQGELVTDVDEKAVMEYVEAELLTENTKTEQKSSELLFDNDETKEDEPLAESEALSVSSINMLVGDTKYLCSTSRGDSRTARVISDNSEILSADIAEITQDGYVFSKITALKRGITTVKCGYFNEGVFISEKEFSVSVGENKLYTACFSEPSDGNSLEINLGKSYNCKLKVFSDAELSSDRISIKAEDENILSLSVVSASYKDYYTLFNIRTDAVCDGSTVISVTDMLENLEIARLPVIVSRDYSSNTPTASDLDLKLQVENADGKITYVLNIKSKKFHKTDCRGVRDMKEENKSELIGTRDEAISMGYTPCGTCKP